MSRLGVHARIEELGIIPSVRLYSAEDAIFAAESVAEGGIPIVEVPMTVPGGVDVIRELTRRNPTMVVGAGSVLDKETAQQCVDAGAGFLTSTGFDMEVVTVAHKTGVAMLPGALTPTEVVAAFKAGCDIVKIFPCSQVGGPSYIRVLKAPLPQVPLIAAGGVNQENVGEFIRAGAIAVGIGSNLILPEAVHRREPAWIKKLASQYLKLVKAARERRAHHVQT
jgi:2-dehydro-3-deoxyphosphogluconate aldolase/(4S)-4-hydroxy-2-oxoglutarate aldolase